MSPLPNSTKARGPASFSKLASTVRIHAATLTKPVVCGEGFRKAPSSYEMRLLVKRLTAAPS